MPDLALPPLKRMLSPNHSSRRSAEIRLIVIHDCQGHYDGARAWFMEPASQVSAHLVLREDGAEATHMVDYDNKAWHAKKFNDSSVGLEMSGFAEKGFSPELWKSAAAITAFLLASYGLPARWTAGGPGFCSHYNLGAAGGGHKDPTTDNDVWQRFVLMVQEASRATMPVSWDGLDAAPVAALPAGFTPHIGDQSGLRPGSLEWAQMRLAALASANPAIPSPGRIDGIMGAKTRAALKAFQAFKKIPATDVLDLPTKVALQ